jgi:hypothetical protein
LFNETKEHYVKFQHVLKLVLILAAIAASCSVAAFGGTCGLGISSPVFPEGPGSLFAGSAPPPGSLDGVLLQGNMDLHIKDSCGHTVNGWHAQIDTSIFVISNRTHLTFLGANYGWALILGGPAETTMSTGPNATYTPTAATLAAGNGIKQTMMQQWADPFFVPLSLAWNKKHGDIVFSAGEQFPAQNYVAPAVAFAQNPPQILQQGFGHLATSLTFGGTYHISPTVDISILNHYDILHPQQSHADFKLGQQYHYEWGISKVFLKNGFPALIAGPTGLGHLVTTNNEGAGLAAAGITPGVKPWGGGLGFQVIKPFKSGFGVSMNYNNLFYGRSFGLGSEWWLSANYNIHHSERVAPKSGS